MSNYRPLLLSSIALAALLSALPVTASAQGVYDEYAVENPRFSIAMTDGNSEAAPGEVLTYQIAITNESLVGVANVRLTATLPRELIANSASDGGFFIGQFAQWNGMSFKAGERKVVSMHATIPLILRNASVIITTAQIEGGPPAQDMTVVQRTGIGKGSGIAIAKTPQTVQPGGTVTYTITVYNDDAATKSIDVRVSVDRQLSFVTASDQGHSRGRSQVVWSDLFVDAHSSSTVSLTLRASEDARPADALQMSVSANTATAYDATLVDESTTQSVSARVDSTATPELMLEKSTLVIAQADDSADDPVSQLLPQTGASGFTEPVENLRAFLRPVTADHPNSVGLLLIAITASCLSAAAIARRLLPRA